MHRFEINRKIRELENKERFFLHSGVFNNGSCSRRVVISFRQIFELIIFLRSPEISIRGL